MLLNIPWRVEDILREITIKLAVINLYCSRVNVFVLVVWFLIELCSVSVTKLLK